MTALLFLNRSDTGLVRHGYLDEPGFRPHPRSQDHDEVDSDDPHAQREFAARRRSREMQYRLEQTLRAHHWTKEAPPRTVELGR